MSTEVLLLSLGGTIASTQGPGQALAPALGGEEIAALTLPIDEVVVRARTVASVPGASVTIPLLARAHDWASTWLADGSGGRAGVVITTGTDTLEEIAFLLDLHWESDATVVVTGAMRAPGQRRSDAGANLEGAVRVAASESSAGRGVLVVMNGRIFDATTVTKSHSSSVGAFRSTSRAVGSVTAGRVRFHAPPRRHLPMASDFSAWRGAEPPWVPIVTPALADPPRTLAACLDGDAEGIVLGAWGVGHVPDRWVPEVERAAARVPVVLTTGTGAGSVATDTYGFPGSETSLLAAGAFPAGFLTPRKARAWLCAALVHGIGNDEVRRGLAERGRRPGTDLRGHA